MSLLFSPRLLLQRLRTAYALNPTRFRAAFLIVLAVVVVGMSLKYAAKAAKPGDDGRQTRSAFLRWRGMIHDLFAGENIYVGVNEYPNPPIMAVVLRPFAELPPLTGALTWFYAKVLMAVLSAVWAFRLVAPLAHARGSPGGTQYSVLSTQYSVPSTQYPVPSTQSVADDASELVSGTQLVPDGAPESVSGTQSASADSPTPERPLSTPHSVLSTQYSPGSDAAKALAILFALPPLLGDLSHNNVNIFILFLVAGCLEAYRRKWDVASGLVLALAIACKVTPLFFVAYFGWKRAWRVLAGCGVGLVLWLFVVPGVVYGWDRNAELLESWYRLMVRPAVVENRVTSEHPNQSLPGITYRLLTQSPSFIVYDKTPQGDIPRPAAFHNFTDIGTDAARWLVKAQLVGFGLLILLLCRTPRSERQGLRFAAECSLIVLGMLLFSERTWKHHAVTLLFPFTVIAYALTVELAPRARTLLVGVLVGVGVLTLGTGALPGRAADLAMAYGTYTLAFLLLTAGVCAILANLPLAPALSYADTHEPANTSP